MPASSSAARPWWHGMTEERRGQNPDGTLPRRNAKRYIRTAREFQNRGVRACSTCLLHPGPTPASSEESLPQRAPMGSRNSPSKHASVLKDQARHLAADSKKRRPLSRKPSRWTSHLRWATDNAASSCLVPETAHVTISDGVGPTMWMSCPAWLRTNTYHTDLLAI